MSRSSRQVCHATTTFSDAGTAAPLCGDWTSDILWWQHSTIRVAVLHRDGASCGVRGALSVLLCLTRLFLVGIAVIAPSALATSRFSTASPTRMHKQAASEKEGHSMTLSDFVLITGLFV
jgi:hypothetical protein